MASNYYELLGVSQTASLSEIRAAYRQQVKEYHPDVSDYVDSEMLFKQLKTAYDVLGHREKREKYNRIGHDEYVDRHGGYSTNEIEQATETFIQPYDDRTAEEDWQRDQQRRLSEQRSTTERQSMFRRFLSFVINGRTPNSDGKFAILVRLAAYGILTAIISLPITVIADELLSTFLGLATVLLVSRIVYLAGFEYLRDEYIKVDTNPEPDAYTIPYAVGLGVASLGLIAIGGLLAIAGTSILGALGRFSVIPFAIGLFLVLPIALLWAVLSVGFGVADDHYNLQYDANPILWNFAVQAPLLIILAGFGDLSTPFLAVFLSLPFIVCLAYLLLYHWEVGSELRWRIANGRLYSS